MSRGLSWSWMTRVAVTAFVAACSGTPADPGHTAPPPPVPARIVLVSGGGQQADPGDSLQDPIVFMVQDSSGAPVPGVMVTLVPTIGNGSVPQAKIPSDSNGLVTTAWTMGPGGGAQILEARTGTLTATVNALTCQPDACYPEEQLAGSFAEMSLLPLTTYEGSGQTVHPTVARGHGSATGFWLAVTPYPAGAAMYENPSLYHSRSAHDWSVPPGAANPLALPGNNIYLSDPSLVVNSDQHLWLYYREVQLLTVQNIIELIRSRDGVHWDPPVTVVTAPSHQIVSPAVVRGAPGAAWQMWSVNAGPNGCTAATTTVERRTSADGLNWSGAVPVSLTQQGQNIWHIDVQWIPARNEYWALYNSYPLGGSCATNALWLATSPDGMTWTTYPSPVTRAGVIDAFNAIVYRSTMLIDPHATRVIFWISGASYNSSAGYNWRTATVSTTVNNLFAIITAPNVAIAVPQRRDLPPPEPDLGP